MDVTLRQLRTIREIATHGSIAAAATSLGYTPSAVSQQVAALERVAGTAMLERVGRGVQLTDAGRALADHVGPILAGVDGAAAAVERAATTLHGSVRLAIFESFANACMGQVLAELADRAPGIQLHSTQLDPDRALDALLAGMVDMALVLDYPHAPSPRPRGVQHHTILVEPFRLAVPENSTIVGPVDLATMADHAFVAGTLDSSCRRCTVGACREAGFEPTVHHELDNLAASLRIVGAGAGVTLLPDLALSELPPGVRVVDLVTPVHRRVDLCHRDGALRPTVAATRDVLLGLFAPRA